MWMVDVIVCGVYLAVYVDGGCHSVWCLPGNVRGWLMSYSVVSTWQCISVPACDMLSVSVTG